jgi:hypothetical protein
MKRVYLVIFASFFLYSACTIVSAGPDRSTDEAMLNFLPYLNQKVAGYLDANNVTSLDMKTYRDIVDKVCGPLPSCGKNAAIMFDTYDVQPRMLNGIFSVMICDKESTIKIMEDFSCNEQKVEIPSFQIDPKARCAFEDKWKEKIAMDCPGT